MTELPDLTPPWSRIPLVNDETALFDQQTTDALDTMYRESLGEEVASKTSPVGLTLWKRAPKRALTFYDADPTGVADASAAFATALSEVPAGGTLEIPLGTFKLPDVSITRADVNVEGPGTVNGRITIGQADRTLNLQGRGFQGVKFVRSGPVADPTFAGIRVINVERLRVQGCWFQNMSSAIYSYANAGNDVAKSIIVDNKYYNVGYFYRAVNASDAVWRAHADIDMFNNEGHARITHVKMDSVDGLTAIGNRFFFFGNAAQDQQKERHFDIGFSDWLKIKSNVLFESGLESIYLEDPNHFEVEDNHIAWPSQRANRDAISITAGVGRSGDATAAPRTDLFGTVGGGNISQWAKNAIGFYGSGRVDHVVVLPMSLERASGNPPTYYGTEQLGTPRRVFLSGTLTNLSPGTPAYNGDLQGTIFDEIRSRVTATERWLHPRAKEVALPSRDQTINQKTTLFILRDLNQQSTATTIVAGRILLDIRSVSAVPSPAKAAVYDILVGTSPDGTKTCQVMGAAGSSIAAVANTPAFTFTVEHDGSNLVLRATPVGTTAGAFAYSAVSTGNLILG